MIVSFMQMQAPAETRRMARAERLSRRLIPIAGYGAMITLLLISAFEAYRTQGSLSERNVEIYRQYVQQDESLLRARRSIWRGSLSVRDFFLSEKPNRVEVLKSEMAAFRNDSISAIQSLNIPDAGGDEVKKRVQEFWDALEPVAGMTHLKGGDAHDFIMREVVPRRTDASAALAELTQAGREAVENSEREFAANRQMASSRLLVMLGLSLFVGLMVAGFSIWRTEHLESERARHYEEVLRAKHEMEHLSMRLLEVQEEERGRLSRELHDEIGQTLTALRIEISRSQTLAGKTSPEVSERLGRALQLAERVVHNVRDISHLLRPSALDDLGLVPALHSQTQEFSRRSGIQCVFTENAVHDALPTSVKTCVYRVVQEALHNCEKHAGATTIHVKLRQGATSLDLAVEDDGRGTGLGSDGLPEQRGGCGVLGMRERISMVGGSFSMESSRGSGLRLSVRIPLPIDGSRA
jgi:signal transduction histidine kinase